MFMSISNLKTVKLHILDFVGKLQMHFNKKQYFDVYIYVYILFAGHFLITKQNR